jgi:hypothetical protein
MLRRDVVEDVFGLILCKALIRLKWWELIEIVVEFVPPGMKLTDHPVT